MTPCPILIVDDEPSVSLVVKKLLDKEGIASETVNTGEEAIDRLETGGYALVISDIKMPGMDGMELLRLIGEMMTRPEVVLMTGFATIDTAVEAIKLGAFDFITKPLDLNKLVIIVRNALEKQMLRNQVSALKTQVEETLKLDNIVGSSLDMLKIFDTVRKIKNSDVNVLITGESGTGKELVARAVHMNSNRGDGQFIPVNSVALSESLLESELFGHEKGSFTGATARKLGYFETARGGTIFLDEIGDLASQLQAKLLRTLQERTIQRVGSSEIIPIDVRIIAATNKDLTEMVEAGTFREDLFYRLNVLSLELPPLRERKDDIPQLVKHFIKKHGGKTTAPVEGITSEAKRFLEAYDWPGNIRELENVIQRAIALAEGPEIGAGHLHTNIIEAVTNRKTLKQNSCNSFSAAKRSAVESFEKEYISEALRRHGGNITRAADEVGLARPALQRMVRKYGINPKSYKT